MKKINSDEDIELIVTSFYTKTRDDERLGYIFDDIAQINWDKHLPKMINFWSNFLFRTGRYVGHPFRQHLSLPIQEGDFDRWYRLFEETVDELYEGERAVFAKEMARNIASSFQFRLERDELIKKS